MVWKDCPGEAGVYLLYDPYSNHACTVIRVVISNEETTFYYNGQEFSVLFVQLTGFQFLGPLPKPSVSKDHREPETELDW